jgi:hypothetical protein
VTPRASCDRESGQGRQDQRPRLVTHDKDPGRGDKNLTSGDRDDRLIRHAAEPPYDSGPAAPAPPHTTQRTAGPAAAVRTAHDRARPTTPRRRATATRDTTDEPTDYPESASPVWTVEAVRRLGLTTDIETAGSILGIGRTKAYELARTGNFPVKVLRNGRKYLVAVPAILRALDVD